LLSRNSSLTLSIPSLILFLTALLAMGGIALEPSHKCRLIHASFFLLETPWLDGAMMGQAQPRFFGRGLRDEMRGWVCLSTDVDSRPTDFDRCTNRPRERPKGPNLPVVREGTRAPVFSSPSLNLLFSATKAEIDVHALVPKGGSSTSAQQMFGN
jgi:hypothetical protein